METMKWINLNDSIPIIKGLYMCYIPKGKRFYEHYAEYWWDGTDFRDGDTLFKGVCGGRRITNYITHWMIIKKP